MPKWDARLPLRAYIRQQATVDAKLRRILMSAANDARGRIAGASNLRAAQLELAQRQLRLWAEVGTVVEDGIRMTPQMVTNVNQIFTDDLLRGLGVTANEQFRRTALAQANNTIRTYLAHQHLGMTLSERVYKNGQVASGRIDRIVSNGILRGASAREIARDVAGLINPNTPGGVSYAAMRLGRTELNNAFHQASADQARANPFIERVLWELSASHPRPDECDALVGRYHPDNVPDKPHPQCLCYITAETISREQLVRRFKRGEFNEWADGMLTA